MGGAGSTHGERKRAYRVWVGIPEGKTQRADPGVDGNNIKMDFQEVI